MWFLFGGGGVSMPSVGGLRLRTACFNVVQGQNCVCLCVEGEGVDVVFNSETEASTC